MSRLDDQAFIYIAKYFQVLGEPMRLKILNALRDGEKNVTELTLISGGTQANVSKHLALLRDSNLIVRDSRGTKAYYSIYDQRIFELCNLVCDQIVSHIHMESLTNQAFIAGIQTNQAKQ